MKGLYDEDKPVSFFFFRLIIFWIRLAFLEQDWRAFISYFRMGFSSVSIICDDG